MTQQEKDYIDEKVALLALAMLLLLVWSNTVALKNDAQNNLVLDSSPVPDLDGKTGAAPVIKHSVSSAVGATCVNADGSSSRIAKINGIFRAAYGATTVCKVIPNGGADTVTGESGTDSVVWAGGDVLFAAPDGTMGTLATLQAHVGWAGNFETAQIGIITDNGSGILRLQLDIKIGTPL